MRWNGAIYHELWKKFQFAFLGANSFTEIHNGKDAQVNGIETDSIMFHGGLTLNAAAAYTDAKTKGNICSDGTDLDPNCQRSPTTSSLRRAALVCQSRRSSRARPPPATPGRLGPTSRRTSRARLSYQGSAPSSIRTEIELVGTHEHRQSRTTSRASWELRRLVDLFAGLGLAAWNVELFGTNIFDKRNDLSRFTACGSCTRALVVPGRPRTIGIRAGMKF